MIRWFDGVDRRIARLRICRTNPQRNFHVRPFRSVAHRVAHDVLDRAAQQIGRAHDLARIAVHEPHVAIAGGGFELGVGRDLHDQRVQIDERLARRTSASLQARQRQQVADQFIEALGFAADPCQRRRCDCAGVAAGQFQGDVQPRQRRAQFMRNIAQQALLGRQQGFDLAGHAIEVAAEFADLIVPPRQTVADACGEIAGGELPCRGLKPAHRRGEISRQRVTDQARGEDHRHQPQDQHLRGHEQFEARRQFWRRPAAGTTARTAPRTTARAPGRAGAARSAAARTRTGATAICGSRFGVGGCAGVPALEPAAFARKSRGRFARRFALRTFPPIESSISAGSTIRPGHRRAIRIL